MTDLEILLKAHWAPTYINFEGGARGEKTQFFGQKFLKSALKRIFFSKVCMRPITFGQNRVFIVIWKSSENQFGRPKEKVDKIFKMF